MSLNKVVLIILLCLAATEVIFAQVVQKIGVNPTTIDASAVLELESTNKGFLLPRMTTAQRNAIVNPANGLVIFNITSNELQTNTGTTNIPVWISPGVGNNRVVSYEDSNAITINADTTDFAIQTNTQSSGILTINAPTGTIGDGQRLVLRVTSTNTQTYSWNAVFAFSTDLPKPTTNTGGGKTDYLGFQYMSSTNRWHLVARNFGF